MLYLGLLTWPMMAVGWTVTLVVRGCVSMHRLEKLLNEIPEIRDPETGGDPPRVPAPPLALRADQLTFSWPGAEQPAVDGVSFELPPGRHLGIVGGVGSGKTTLLALLQRHYDAQRGTVSLGGVELKDLPLAELRRHIAPVAQEAFLFSLTLAENISLGREGDPAPAAESAALGGDLRELPQGLTTEVGERGITLSGGQRQRTALARALFNPPQILLLDDTLSAVDAQTEAKLLAHLRRDLQGRSVVIVAHKLSAVAHCDEILVLERGRVVQRGAHADLLAQPGPYQNLARLQRYLDETAEKSA
jgi:ABC-type multidrug transport system fused ATPase/permease subunit